MLLSGVLFVLFLDGCWLYCLADAALTPASEYRGLSKMAWLCVIIATFIVGAIAWIIVRRKSRTKSRAAAQVSRTTLTGPADPGVTWYANGAAADAAVARHPAGLLQAGHARRLDRPQGPGRRPRVPAPARPPHSRHLCRLRRVTQDRAAGTAGAESGPVPAASRQQHG